MLHRHCLDDPLLIKFSGIYIYTRIGPIVLWICNLSRFWLSCLGPLVILLPKIYLNYLVFQPFDLERRWWRSFQKRVLCTKLDIYVFIKETFYRHIYLSFCFYLFIYFIFCFMFIYLVLVFFLIPIETSFAKASFKNAAKVYKEMFIMAWIKIHGHRIDFADRNDYIFFTAEPTEFLRLSISI